MSSILNIIKRKLIRGYDNEIDYNKMKEICRINNNVHIIDVRTEDEYNDEHLQNAINIPLQNINTDIGRYVKNKNDIIITYCQYGGRGKKAANKLIKMGYRNVYNLKGGIMGI